MGCLSIYVDKPDNVRIDSITFGGRRATSPIVVGASGDYYRTATDLCVICASDVVLMCMIDGKWREYCSTQIDGVLNAKTQALGVSQDVIDVSLQKAVII